MTHPFAGVIFRSMAALCCAAVAVAGPLDPPAGPVASTGKTLTEVEPRIAISAVNTPGDADSLYRITAPGSYYLTGNIDATAGRIGIQIASDHVVLDLGGFTIRGDTDALAGIRSESPGSRGLTIRNGVVAGFPGDGIDLDSFGLVEACVIERISAVGNGAAGIAVGQGAVVRECVAEDNGGDGVRTSFAALVQDCVSRNNGGLGFALELGSSIGGCVATSNSGGGIFVAGRGSITGCVARSNDNAGIEAFSSRVVNCVSTFNVGPGFDVSLGSLVTGCESFANQTHGYVVGSDSRVIDCVGNSNGTTIADGSGVLVTGSDVRVEGNTLNDNDFGVRVTAAGNLIIRNSCAGNGTAFNIVVNNRYGAIVDISAAGGAMVNGPSAASTLTTTDPWANFTY